SRRAAVPQRPGQGGQALPYGAHHDQNRHGLIVDARLTEATGTAAAPSAPTRTTTPPTSSPAAANRAACRMSPRTIRDVARRSMRAPPAIAATRSARPSESGSKNLLAG